jgi:hypothetical protein
MELLYSRWQVFLSSSALQHNSAIDVKDVFSVQYRIWKGNPVVFLWSLVQLVSRCCNYPPFHRLHPGYLSIVSYKGIPHDA